MGDHNTLQSMATQRSGGTSHRELEAVDTRVMDGLVYGQQKLLSQLLGTDRTVDVVGLGGTRLHRELLLSLGTKLTCEEEVKHSVYEELKVPY